MPTTAQKAQFLQKVKELMTDLGAISDRATSLTSIYVDRGYPTGAADPIIQTDLDPYGMTMADMAAMTVVVTALTNLFGGQAVAASVEYKKTINRWRQV